jgi:anti-sigma B factor antagonist
VKHVSIETQSSGQVQVVQLSGFMDMREVPKFEQVLEKLIKSGQPRIVLDLTHLEYISSAGLGAIIGSIREVRRHGGDIKVGGYSASVFDILRTFGFTEVFETLASREEAIRKFKR